MGTNWPKPGFNSTPEYQSSGHVFVVPSSTNNQRIDVVNVAKAITVNTDNAESNPAQISFYDLDDTRKTIDLEGAGSHRFEIKFIRCEITASSNNVGAIVEVTNIPSASFVNFKYDRLGKITT